MSLSINNLSAIAVRLFTPWEGAWVADVDFDLDDSQVVPSGKVVLSLGTTTLLGTVDPTASGRFATHAKARVVGGGNGWSQITPPQSFNNDAGVTASVVINATAAQVGEVAVVAQDNVLDVAFERMGGPAYRVLRDLDWFVDLNGITQVAPRASSPAPSEVFVQEWSGLWQTAKIACDTILVPGMTLTDDRFGTITIRDVEQTFDAAGARATAWCGAIAPASGSRLGSAFGTLARESVGAAFLRAYRYRVVLQNPDGRLVLQAVVPTLGIPDQLPISVWYGAPGVSGKAALGSICALVFLEGDPSLPRVVHFDGATPLEVDVGASVEVKIDGPIVTIGLTAGSVDMGTAPEPLAKGVETTAVIGAELTYFEAVESAGSTFSSSPQAPSDVVNFILALIAANSTCAGALPSLIAEIPTLEVKGT